MRDRRRFTVLYDPKRWDAKVAPVKESPVVESLKRARALVERGWCQNSSEDDKHNVCPSYAVQIATADRVEVYSRGVNLARLAMVKAIGWANIPAWNDHPGRTKAEVLAMFDRAIEIARRDQ
jgi:hypothetical protein